MLKRKVIDQLLPPADGIVAVQKRANVLDKLNPLKWSRPLTLDKIAKRYPPQTSLDTENAQNVIKGLQQQYSKYSSCPVCLQENNTIDTDPLSYNHGNGSSDSPSEGSQRLVHNVKDVPNGTTRSPLPTQPQKLSVDSPTYICQESKMPTHCSEEHYLQDQTHPLVSQVIKSMVQDQVDAQSGRPFWEVNFPTTERLRMSSGTYTPLNWSSWRSIFKTRGFPRVLYASSSSTPNTPHLDQVDTDKYAASRRLVSSLLTYPYTMASIIGGRPWLYYDKEDVVKFHSSSNDGDSDNTGEQQVLRYKQEDVSAVTSSGWHYLSALNQAIDITIKTGRQKAHAKEVTSPSKRKMSLWQQLKSNAAIASLLPSLQTPSVDTKQMLSQRIKPTKLTNDLLIAQLKDSPVFRMFIIGASSECLLMRGAWEQLSHIFQGHVPLQIYFIGEDAHVPKTLQAAKYEQMDALCEKVNGWKETLFTTKNDHVRRQRFQRSYIPCDENQKKILRFGDATFQQYSVAVNKNLRFNFIRSKYTPELHQALQCSDTDGLIFDQKFRPNRDAFFVFNSGMGMFRQFLDQNQKLAQDQSPEFENDVFSDLSEAEQRSLKRQRDNLKSQVQWAMQYQQDWKTTLESIASTKCMAVFTAYNMQELENDISFLSQNLRLTSPDIMATQGDTSDSDTDKKQMEFLIHPVVNHFASQRADIPFDTLGEPHLWAQSNAYLYALRGTGSEIIRDDQDAKSLESADQESYWF
ncbi:hypothetical protein MP228_002155 [Amoeboaphelidium protococcarum]|nr:hypothetical protein MP228_002155 [Amoeboaphelidium protococcarum]